ncbi:MAG: signal recognition particle-docking protein FtsY [Gammaproteobacteria bacterium]
MFRKLTFIGVVLAFSVIVVGSYVRLPDAGLSCPDWPGCYGQIMIGNEADFTARAERDFPGLSPDIAKARKEMSHRYLAAGLGLCVVLLALLSWREKSCRPAAVTVTLTLLMLAGAQAAMGMWAVKMHNMPIVVTAHMLLGLLMFWLIYWLYLRLEPGMSPLPNKIGPARFARFGMMVLFLQIVLGVWTSTNDAGLACTELPLCQGQGWPDADYRRALDPFHGLQAGDAGVLPSDARVAVHWLHRLGAVLTVIVVVWVALYASSARHVKSVRIAGFESILLTSIQFGLGVALVKLAMPIWSVMLHGGLAALSMLPLIRVVFYSRYGCAEPRQAVTAAEPQPQPQPGVMPGVPAEAVEEVYVQPAPETLYLRLKSQLKRTRSGLSDAIAQLPFGQKEISGDVLEQIETSLLMADIGVEATTNIIDRLTRSVERHQLNDAAALSTSLKQELLNILKPCSQPLRIREQVNPFVILVVGVNGAGKTTTIGKLAKRLQAQGLSVMLAAGDTFRAAAVEQLQTWGARNNIHVVAQHTGADSASVIFDGLQSAKAKGVDVLIADTAGRLHTKSNLMDELKKVKRIMARLDESAPHEVLLVLDAGTGQNALSQAKLFNEAVSLTGLVLTKLDGTAKGGVIFALAKQLGLPIRYIGVGEGIDDLQDFDAEIFVDALFAKD